MAFCGSAGSLPSDALASGLMDEFPAVVVSSLVTPAYVRARQADGSFAPESYVVSQGGAWVGCISDDSFDSVSFKEVMQITCRSLAKQNYIPARNPDTAKLLIRIFWGTTGGYDGATSPAQAAQHERRNAMFMGYESALAKSIEYRDSPFQYRYTAILDEFQTGSWGRYFVVVVAYDYRLIKERNQEKPLWLTRLSISGRRNAFNEQLAAMTLAASPYFGQPSNGLVHQALNDGGRVEVGNIKNLGDIRDPGTPPPK